VTTQNNGYYAVVAPSP